MSESSRNGMYVDLVVSSCRQRNTQRNILRSGWKGTHAQHGVVCLSPHENASTSLTPRLQAHFPLSLRPCAFVSYYPRGAAGQ